MKILSRIMIAAGLALLAACAYVEHKAEPIPPSLFEVACAELRADCTNIDPPKVIYSAIVEPYKALGIYFWGEPYIYINSETTLVPWDQVVLHETVHYVIYEAELDYTWCGSEAAARVITARVFNTEVDPEWRVRYKCPAPL